MTTQRWATLSFVFATIQAKVEALGLAPEIETAVHQQLIPAIYLDRVAKRSRGAERRDKLRPLSGELLESPRQHDSPLQALDACTRAEIESVAAECANLFQRSSACVEGRNGQLALHHYGKHSRSARKLSALTAAHKNFIRPADGTAAAARCFGQPTQPMFSFLLRQLDAPPRPARKRPRAAPGIPRPGSCLAVVAGAMIKAGDAQPPLQLQRAGSDWRAGALASRRGRRSHGGIRTADGLRFACERPTLAVSDDQSACR